MWFIMLWKADVSFDWRTSLAAWTDPEPDSARSGLAWLAAAPATTRPAASSAATTTLRMVSSLVTRHRTAPHAKAGGAAAPRTSQKTVS